MLVRFWGTRGSIPAPGQATAKYGGNTSCVELRADDGTLLVLDCGTGARELGLSLTGERPVRAHLLITHTHWDHIQGFPFFTPAFIPDSEITVYAPTGFAMSLGHALSDQMQHSYFPVQLEDLTSKLHLVDVEEGSFQIGPIRVQTQYLNHTAPTLGYRISVGGTTVVYATDHEPFAMDSDRLIHPGDERHAAFLDRADLLIHDSQYALEEYPGKLGWGHSPTTYSVNMALRAGVRRLALSHHDPTHDDALVQTLESRSQAQAADRPEGTEVFAAAEGMELYLPEQPGGIVPLSDRSSFDRRPVAGTKVLLVSSVTAHVESITRVLEQEGLAAFNVASPEQALRLIQRTRPEAIVLDGSSLGDGVYSLAAALRAELRSENLTLLLLTPALDAETIQRSTAAGITDYLAIPFSAPMLYCRLRTRLTRYDRVERPRLQAASPVPPPSPAAPRHSGAERKADILAGTALFAPMTHEELVTLGRRSRHRVFAPGQVIVEQGMGGGTLYVIVAGRVRVVARPGMGQSDEVLLDELGAGDFFGELSSLDDLSYSATVRAVTRTRCLAIPRGDFLGIIERNPAFNLRLLLSLSHRLRQTDRLVIKGGPDTLTALPTKEAVEDQYRQGAAIAPRRGQHLALLRIDIDGLKEINETYGRSIGDEVLCTLADSVRATTRETDMTGRMSADNFVTVLTDARQDGAALVAARIIRTFKKLVKERGLPEAATCSIRYSATQDPPASLDEWLAVVDRSGEVSQDER